MTGIRGEFSAKEDALRKAIKDAQQGKADQLDQFTGRWAYMRDILTETARAKQ